MADTKVSAITAATDLVSAVLVGETLGVNKSYPISLFDTRYQASSATLSALASFNTNGVMVQTAANTFTGRTLTGTAAEITVTNGNGVSGAPTFSLPSSLTFTSKTITGGTFSSTAAMTLSGLLTTAASSASSSGFNLPHGAAPTTPVNGDMWTTSAGGLFNYINGTTYTVGRLEASEIWTGQQQFKVSSVGAINSISGTAGAIMSIANTSPSVGPAVMEFHRPGIFASLFGLDTDNIWKVGGWSAGLNSYKIMHEGLASGTMTGAFTWSGVQTFSAIPVVSAGAITFPSAQVASAGANDLDDYEEGTFTPVMTPATTAGSGTYTTQTGKYTKIGNVVSFTINLAWTAHTGTGAMQITGLPFTVGTTGTPCVVYFNSVTFTGIPQALANASTTTITIETVATGGASTGLTLDTNCNIRANGQFFV